MSRCPRTNCHENSWKWFLQASRTFLNSSGPPISQKNKTFQGQFVRTTTFLTSIGFRAYDFVLQLPENKKYILDGLGKVLGRYGADLWRILGDVLRGLLTYFRRVFREVLEKRNPTLQGPPRAQETKLFRTNMFEKARV